MPGQIANTIVPRNQVAQSPLMKKGGVHEKSATSKRRESKAIVEAELEDWREAVEFEREVLKKIGRTAALRHQLGKAG